MQCPPDHKHALTTTCYIHHKCRCAPCVSSRQARRQRPLWEARRLEGKPVQVSALGSLRRLQALAFMGWSAQEIAARYGSHYRPLLKIRDGHRVRVAERTHRMVAAAFRDLAMTEAPGHSGRVTRGRALARGWHGPLAWDDIDNPAEQPSRA